MNTIDKKERKRETNMNLYLKMTEVRTEDIGYKPEASTEPSHLARHYFYGYTKNVSKGNDHKRGLNISPGKNLNE